jgi:hypothetical protein
MSFIKIENNSRPKTEPWGTPDFIFRIEEKQFPNLIERLAEICIH